MPSTTGVHLTTKQRDHQYEDYLVTQVVPTSSGWMLTLDTGLSVAVPRREGGPVPITGSLARCYGLGPGFRIRGMDIDRQELYYRTAEEETQRAQRAIDTFNQRQP